MGTPQQDFAKALAVLQGAVPAPVSSSYRPMQGWRNPGYAQSPVNLPAISSYQPSAEFLGSNTPKPSPITAGIGAVLDLLNKPMEWVDTGIYRALGGQVQPGQEIDFGDVLDQLGWKVDPNQKGLLHDLNALAHGAASFVGDIVTDPLTYLTLGAGSVVKKVGESVLKAAIKDVAEKAGVEVAKGAKDVARGTVDNIYNKMISSGATHEEAKAASDAAYEQIQNAVKAARAKVNNSLVNIDIPFTNKVMPILQRPQFLRKTEETIGDLGSSQIRELFGKYGIDTGAQSDLLKARYGISDPAQMTTQMFDDFLKRLSNVKVEIPQTVATKATKATKKAKAATEAEKALEEARQAVQKALSGKFVADAAGMSALGRRVANTRVIQALNPRTFGSADTLANQAAKLTREAEGKIRGSRYESKITLDNIRKLAEGLSDDELRTVNYVMENAFPNADNPQVAALIKEIRAAADTGDEGKVLEKITELNDLNQRLHMAQFSPEKIDQIHAVANELSRLYQELGVREMNAGVLSKMIPNYAYHHLTSNVFQTSDDLQKWLNRNGKFLGRSMKNKSDIERKGFASFAELDNAITSILKKLETEKNAKKRESLQKKLASLENLFERNPIKAAEERSYRSARSRAMGELYSQFKDMGLLRQTPPPREQVSKFIHLKASEAEKLGLPKAERGYWIHKDVYEGIQRVNRLFEPAVLHKFAQDFISITNMFKTLVTTYIPSHHIGNFIGNVSNMLLAGATPASFKDAIQIIRDAKAGKLSPDDEKIFRLAVDKGILGTHSSIDVFDPLARAGSRTLQKAEQAVAHGPWKLGDKARQISDTIDNYSRMALFIKALKQYGNADHAAEVVRKYLFNYNEITATDKFMRSFPYPFWVWMKNNIPLQVMELLRQPRFFATYQKLQNALFGGDQQRNPLVPDWAKAFLNVPGTNLFWNPRLPLADLYQIKDGSTIVQTAMGNANPLLRIGPEYITNQQFYTGKKIDPYSAGMPSASAELAYLWSQLGIAPRVQSAISQIGSNPLDALLSLTIGRAYNIDPNIQQRALISKEKEQRRLDKYKRIDSQAK